MNILILNASPRKNGYTAQVLREIQKSIDPQHLCEWVDINNINIKPCQGCLSCRPCNECVLPEDDGHRIARLIKHSDALVIGSPTYFSNITGPLRTLIDRSLTAFEEIAASGLEIPVPLHKGKKAAIVTACNMPAPGSRLPGQHGAGALSAMEVTVKAGGYDLVGQILVDGAAMRNGLSDDIKAEARTIAKEITA